MGSSDGTSSLNLQHLHIDLEINGSASHREDVRHIVHCGVGLMRQNRECLFIVSLCVLEMGLDRHTLLTQPRCAREHECAPRPGSQLGVFEDSSGFTEECFGRFIREMCAE